MERTGGGRRAEAEKKWQRTEQRTKKAVIIVEDGWIVRYGERVCRNGDGMTSGRSDGMGNQYGGVGPGKFEDGWHGTAQGSCSITNL